LARLHDGGLLLFNVSPPSSAGEPAEPAGMLLRPDGSQLVLNPQPAAAAPRMLRLREDENGYMLLISDGSGTRELHAVAASGELLWVRTLLPTDATPRLALSDQRACTAAGSG